MQHAFEHFLESAQQFCGFIDRAESLEAQPRAVLAHLARLYAATFFLSPAEPTETFDVWSVACAKPVWSGLGQSYYAVVENPFDLEGPEIGTGDLDDDIVDIYFDVKRGLVAYEAGHHRDAQWFWIHSFESHWGAHAANAISALHRLISDDKSRRSEKIEPV